MEGVHFARILAGLSAIPEHEHFPKWIPQELPSIVAALKELCHSRQVVATYACVRLYATPRTFGETLLYIALRVIHAIRSLFGCSAWQQTRNLLIQKAQAVLSAAPNLGALAYRQIPNLDQLILEEAEAALNKVLNAYNRLRQEGKSHDLARFEKAAEVFRRGLLPPLEQVRVSSDRIMALNQISKALYQITSFELFDKESC